LEAEPEIAWPAEYGAGLAELRDAAVAAPSPSVLRKSGKQKDYCERVVKQDMEVNEGGVPPSGSLEEYQRKEVAEKGVCKSMKTQGRIEQWRATPRGTGQVSGKEKG
jgi:hypothetical protein